MQKLAPNDQLDAENSIFALHSVHLDENLTYLHLMFCFI